MFTLSVSFRLFHSCFMNKFFVLIDVKELMKEFQMDLSSLKKHT